MRKITIVDDVEFISRLNHTEDPNIDEIITYIKGCQTWDKVVKFTEDADIQDIWNEIESSIKRYMESKKGKQIKALSELGFK